MQELWGLTNWKSMSHFSASDYLSSSAASKQSQLWSEITAKHDTGHFPSKLGLAGLFIEPMESSFSTKGDVMKTDFTGTRTKFIHSVGTHGKVVLNSNGNHPFTGLFQGATTGIVRLSSAAQPELGTSSPLGPGMGLKFLRDGMDSANLVAMYSVNGQPGEWNFFQHEFKNHIAAAEGKALKAVAAKFATATDWIQEVGLSDWAKFSQQGKQVSGKPVFPWRIDMTPNPSVTKQFSNSEPSDPMNYLDQLKAVPANSVLYTLYGWTAPPQIGGKKVEIGTLQLDGKLVTSKWGDEKLFIRHQKMDADIKYQPGWKPFYASFKLDGKCPYETMLQELGLY